MNSLGPQRAPNQVCAIFTTFRPGPQVVQNIRSVMGQIERLVVVDNGSGDAVVSELRQASVELGFHLISNDRNLGIAAALNLGCQWAIGEQSKFLLLLDQDSEATYGMVSALLDNLESGRRIGLAGAKVIERGSGASPPLLLDRAGDPLLTSTSGSLIPASVFKRCGPFDAELFIEYVDHEYCLRIRSQGYRIVVVDNATLKHEVGFPRIHRLLGFCSCRCTHHAAGRRYYFVRNLFALLPRYWRTETAWCKAEVKSFAKSTIKIFFFERYRTKKLWMAFRGVIDGVTGRMGERVKL